MATRVAPGPDVGAENEPALSRRWPLAPLRDRLAARRIPSWLLGAALALITWRIIMVPEPPGLDSSWHAGLAMATKQGLQFGTEVIFSYGPLGFLAPNNPGGPSGVTYQDLAGLAFLYDSVLYVGLCIALVWALRRCLPAWAAVGAGFLLLVLLPTIDRPVVLGAFLSLGMLQRRGPAINANVFAVLIATLAAFELLIRISIGPLVLAMGLIALIGLRVRWWQIGGLLALFAAEVLVLWIASGQSLGNFPDYLSNSKEIVTGYNEAMALRPYSSSGSLLAALAPLGVIAGAAMGGYRDRLARWAAVALVALACFWAFKHGVVRFDVGHIVIWLSTACFLWVAIPWQMPQRGVLIGGAVLLAAGTFHVAPPDGASLDAIGNLTSAYDQAKTLLVPSRLQALEDAGRVQMRDSYRLDPATLAALDGHSVSVDPWEIGVVWAYGLDWAPLPVFQNYSAYTDKLDELNAAEIQDPSGPERILRTNSRLVVGEYGSRGIDTRFPAWDPPAQARATLCHFATLHATAHWQVLGRVPDRCGKPKLIRTSEAGYDEVVRVPKPGPREVVFAQVQGIAIGGLERLWAALWRPGARYAIVNENEAQRYRIVPGTAENGLILRASDGVAGGSGPFSQTPQARTIEFTGASGELRFKFFAVKVRAAG